MIREIVERKGVLQANPDFLDDKVVLFNFDRQTNMKDMKEGDEWDLKITSPLIPTNKTDKAKKLMFYQYVLPIRRIEKWIFHFFHS